MSFFRSLWKREKKETKPTIDPKQGKGAIIGQKYAVCKELGRGGFGVVYLVRLVDNQGIVDNEVFLALKTFKDEYLADELTRELFRKEAETWVNLGIHPYIVNALLVDEIEDRLYVAMEYVPKNQQGLNSLQGYLENAPPDLTQSLLWSIQFCYGIEYAYSKGVHCHRDIKPDNIMISPDKTVKITDFGLAHVLDASKTGHKGKLNMQRGKVGLSSSIFEGGGCGTPTHMPPEQFTNATCCDERSDIYAFGIVLYQMASGGRLPFHASWPRDGSEEEQERFWRESYRLHSQAPIPRLNSPLLPLIDKCLEKEPIRRYRTFNDLRRDLELLLKNLNGSSVEPPQPLEFQVTESMDLAREGYSLSSLGRFEEAIKCYDKYLKINPNDAESWLNKGNCFNSMGKYFEANQCYNKAIELKPQDSMAWNNKGNSFNKLGRFSEAMKCCDKALEINPKLALAWSNKGVSLNGLGRFDDALKCLSKATECSPDLIFAWSNKGDVLCNIGIFEEAIKCYDKIIRINPRDEGAWNDKAMALNELGRFGEAIKCCDKAILINGEFDSPLVNKGNSLNNLNHFVEAIVCLDKALKINPKNKCAWNNKGNGLSGLARFDEAIICYDKAIEINPQDADFWYNKGNAFRDSNRFVQSLDCYKRAIEMNPQHIAWFNKGLVEERMGLKLDAILSFRKFVELNPSHYSKEVKYARDMLHKLEGR